MRNDRKFAGKSKFSELSTIDILVDRLRPFTVLILMLVFTALIFPTAMHGQVTAGQAKKIEQALPDKVISQPKKSRKLLVFSRTDGYRHDAIPFANKTFELMAQKTAAFDVVFSEDLAVFAPDKIKEFDAILLNNTTNLKFDDPVLRKSLLEFVKSGKGLIAIHAATDNFYDWPEAAEMLGAQFDGHPWNGNGTWAIEITDHKHVLNRSFQDKNFQICEEIYRHKFLNLRKNSRVLIGLNMRDKTNLAAKGVHFTDRDVPISWVRKFGKGRVFYCSFGHNPEIYWNAAILQHYLAGIQFAFGDLKANTKPIPFVIENVLDFTELDSLLDQLAAYKFGESLEHHFALREFISLAHQSPKTSRTTEKRLIKFLESDASLDGKQYICQMLGIYGSKRSVNQLAKMLNNSATVEMARFALEKIPDKAVDRAFRKALLKSRGTAKIGIINSIGERRDFKIVPKLKQMIYSEDKNVATAAIAALGKIGNKSAIQALSEARVNLDHLHAEVVDAYLNCADQLLELKKTSEASKIYKTLFSSSEPNTVRYAALNGLVHSGVHGVGELLIEVLKNDNSEMRAAVAMIVRGMPPEFNIRGIVKSLPVLAAGDQVKILDALSSRRDPELLKIVTELAVNKNDDVAIAALQTMGEIGDTSSVYFLAKLACQPNLKAPAARTSLYRLPGNGIESRIVDLMPNVDSNTKFQLIRSLRVRKPRDPDSFIADALLKSAGSNEAKIRLESIRALQLIAKPDKALQLVDLLIAAADETERAALEKTLHAVAIKESSGTKEHSEISEFILSILPNITAIEARRSLLLVLAKIGHQSSLPVLRNTLMDTSTALKSAAIRALSQWPTAEPAQELENLILTSDSAVDRVLALRGFVRMAGIIGKKDKTEAIKRYQRAMELSKNDSERKLVLSGLGTMDTESAFDMAVHYLEVPSLRPEAEVAAVKIAAEILVHHPVKTKKVLIQIQQNSPNTGIVAEAQQHINQIEKFEGFITQWQIAGPFTHESEDLFYFEFPPEKNDLNIEWQTVTAVTDKNAPWQVNLTNLFGGGTFCAAYLRTNIWAEQAQKANLELGSNDGIKAWFNGELIHSNDTSRTVSPAADVVAIELKKGWNTVMIKIRQLGGSWGACARVRNLDGSKIQNLKVQPIKN